MQEGGMLDYGNWGCGRQEGQKTRPRGRGRRRKSNGGGVLERRGAWEEQPQAQENEA